MLTHCFNSDVTVIFVILLTFRTDIFHQGNEKSKLSKLKHTEIFFHCPDKEHLYRHLKCWQNKTLFVHHQ